MAPYTHQLPRRGSRNHDSGDRRRSRSLPPPPRNGRMAKQAPNSWTSRSRRNTPYTKKGKTPLDKITVSDITRNIMSTTRKIDPQLARENMEPKTRPHQRRMENGVT
eukprot:scaffold156549_cov36-Tisochrysis_lutea.AAC.1